MVSLYRAWAAWRGLGGGPGGPGAPDALVQAGGVRFAAHARLLAAHSGYFKSALARPWAPFFGEPDPDPDPDYSERRFEEAARAPPEENVVYVPNISAQQFWPLLAYMYTGFLELTPENVYQVLLAAHLLHMPRALELCRSFLAGGTPLPAPAPAVVKPVASRKLPPFLSAAPFRPLYPEPSVAFLGARHETPFRPVDPSGARTAVPAPAPAAAPAGESAEAGSTTAQIQPDDRTVEGGAEQTRAPAAEPAPPTAPRRDGGAARPATEAGGSHSALDSIKNRKTKSTAKQNATAKKAEPAKGAAEEPAMAKVKSQCQNRAQCDDKVVLDVACCDGPVRFHRVLNSAFESDGSEARRGAEDSGDSDDSYVEIEEDSRSPSDAPYDNCNAFSKSLQKQMSENIRTMTGEGREGRDPEASDSDASSKRDAVYACAYCDHTFKSQYCYQKHARRHINPVSIDAVGRSSPDAAGAVCRKARRLGGAGSAPRREVRLLDMNVQYYPCKTCGSKFPSYYFVHKHRKMCHAEEPDGAEPGKARRAPPGKEVDGGASDKTDPPESTLRR